jgi:hypothetical protein
VAPGSTNLLTFAQSDVLRTLGVLSAESMDLVDSRLKAAFELS